MRPVSDGGGGLSAEGSRTTLAVREYRSAPFYEVLSRVGGKQIKRRVGLARVARSEVQGVASAARPDAGRLP